MRKRSVREIDLRGKRVFLRLDLNVPLDPEGGIRDETRILGALPTIRYVLEKGGRAILASHLGRPKGAPNPQFSLEPVAASLSRHLGRPVALAPDCVGGEVERQVHALGEGQTLLLENLRFHAGETQNDPAFSRSLAALADVYVDDAFGAAHRAHASTAGMAALVAERGVGFLMEKEVAALSSLLGEPERPYLALLGGAKVSDKVGIVRNLLPRWDGVLIGGGMAYTFLKAEGRTVGRSLVEEDLLATATSILREARAAGKAVLLPSDHRAAPSLEESEEALVVPEPDLPDSLAGFDIGPATVERFAEELRRAKTLLWNGPAGVFEKEPFAAGTMCLARVVADSPCRSIVCGGDTVAAVHAAGVADRVTHASTGGGAALEFLEGKSLPGLQAIPDAE